MSKKDNNEKNIISLIDENGVEIEFEVVATFEIEENEYAVLFPTDEEEEEAYILRIDMDENGETILVNIEDQSEFDDVVAAYEALADEII
ncbi:DUF1292 domain-containing protein [Sporosalibacterium faouarense]|uniref:DUF1292 domain-containing protein n=1 Tax=Sporosalibacterium faouarense TaxID=516123 RepID=UPI00141C7B86|nr:DUF1292 domain-containing protein [Sporosalibacterium faouarense]MTI48968.1 DUF1292 domain-containing protein [Bacillota bacterium]